jgi:hypothetical protein
LEKTLLLFSFNLVYSRAMWGWFPGWPRTPKANVPAYDGVQRFGPRVLFRLQVWSCTAVVLAAGTSAEHATRAEDRNIAVWQGEKEFFYALLGVVAHGYAFFRVGEWSSHSGARDAA